MTEGDGEADGEAERLGCGVRDGLGDRVGLGADGVRLGVAAGPEAGGAALAGAGTGRTRKYSASTVRNTTASTMVEMRGRMLFRRLMTRLRSAGRCSVRQGR